jgi:hypothetical protein
MAMDRTLAPVVSADPLNAEFAMNRAPLVAPALCGGYKAVGAVNMLHCGKHGVPDRPGRFHDS